MKKKFVISIITAAVLIILITVFLFTKLNKSKTVIGFYNVPEKTKNALINVIKRTTDDFETIELDSSQTFSEQETLIKKASLVFTLSDSDVIDFSLTSKKVLPISKEKSSGMPVSIANTINSKQDGYSLLPFLYDMYQVDVNYNYLKQTSQLNINSWNDLIKLAKAEKTLVNLPITITFNDDVEFLNIYGQIFEALSTFEEYEELYNELFEAYKKDSKENNNFKNLTDLINAKLEDNYNLKNTSAEFSSMMKEKLITPTSLNFNISDTMFQCDNQLTGMAFLKLSDHRNIARESIATYRSIYVPSIFLDDNRKFVANEYSLMLLKDNEKTQKIISDVVDTMQSELATITGLAPVQKNCGVPDRQADDVRYWLAASSGPLLPLSSAIPSAAARKVAANLLRP